MNFQHKRLQNPQPEQLTPKTHTESMENANFTSSVNKSTTKCDLKQIPRSKYKNISKNFFLTLSENLINEFIKNRNLYTIKKIHYGKWFEFIEGAPEILHAEKPMCSSFWYVIMKKERTKAIQAKGEAHDKLNDWFDSMMYKSAKHSIQLNDDIVYE